MSMTGTSTKKPFWRCRRYWGLVLLIIGFYFCFVPSRFIATSRTAFITTPLQSNGLPDYDRAFLDLYRPILLEPEKNGLRMLIAAVGPRAMEQAYLMDTVPWEELPTHSDSKEWFQKGWLPYCEQMQIDPYKKPRFHDYRDFFSTLDRKRKEEQEQRKAARERAEAEGNPIEEPINEAGWEEKRDADIAFHKQLREKPWTAAEHPEIAVWLEKANPVLDLYGLAVRKPNWGSWRGYMYDGKNDAALWSVLLPDVQSQRAFGRDLLVRISRRIADGDLDGAWYDAMSLYRGGRQLAKEPVLVSMLVGNALEGMGCEAVAEILSYGKPTSEQIFKFSAEFNTLPGWPKAGELETIEIYSLYKAVHSLGKWKSAAMIREACSDTTNDSFNFYDIFSLPVDHNIIGERLTRNIMPLVEACREVNPKTRIDKLAAIGFAEPRVTFWRLWEVPLIRTRSQLLADVITKLFTPAVASAYKAFNARQMRNDLVRLALAVECYRAEKGEYPESLDALIPVFIDEMPLDLFTGRDNLAYKQHDNGFMIYSFGNNGRDDGGVSSNIIGDSPDDIVFRVGGK